MKIEISDELINDNIFRCSQCSAKVMCFIEQGDTQFCPNCGSRDLEPIEDKE